MKTRSKLLFTILAAALLFTLGMSVILCGEDTETIKGNILIYSVSDEVTACTSGLYTKRDTDETKLLQPGNIEYLGAFRLPNVSEEYGWLWSGEALCFNALGNDGQHSLFGTGHNHRTHISEISIPIPVKSKNIKDLPLGLTLQPFNNIRSSLYDSWNFEIPRAGLEILNNKLFFCWGDHMQDGDSRPTHGYTSLDLSNSNPISLWSIGDYNYSTNDYLFKVPKTWSDKFAPGFDMATGRFRDGGWGGMGPSVIIFKTGSMIKGQNVETKVLIRYTDVDDYSSERDMINNYSEADSWTGAAWVDSPTGAALILVGTHGYGKTWYGFSNGVEYPIDGIGPFPEVPPYPHDERGWWNDNFKPTMIFYSPVDLAKTAHNQMENHKIQPYAMLDLSEYMIVERDETVMQYLGAMAYDDINHRLFVMELHADGDKPVVHVFGVDNEVGEYGSNK